MTSLHSYLLVNLVRFRAKTEEKNFKDKLNSKQFFMTSSQKVERVSMGYSVNKNLKIANADADVDAIVKDI